MDGADVAIAGRRDAAVAGSLAAGVALAAGELASGLASSVPSLVLAVADVVVDLTPGGIVRWSIDTVGSRQKAALVAGIVVFTLGLGAWFGIMARRRFWAGAAGFIAFGLVGGWAGARGEASSNVAAWLSAAVATGVGLALLRGLLALAASSAADLAAPDRRLDERVRSRRRFLLAAGATAVVTLSGAAAGSFLRLAGNVEAARSRVAARLRSRTAPPVPAGVEVFDPVDGITPLVTPNGDFYRIDTAILVPQVDPTDWTLAITGLVDRPLEFTLDDLMAMDLVDEYITLSCVSNEVGGDLVGNAWWSGVPLADLLDRVEVRDAATQVVGRSVDGWTGGFPYEIATDGRPAMVAVAMGGEPLPVEHGFPARLVVPGLYGYVSATKWLAEIELTTWDGFDGYWIPRGWAKEGPIKTQSRIDVPRRGATVPAGRTAIAGMAWAPIRTISAVEVRVDDEPWLLGRLSGPLSDSSWVQWVVEADLAPGSRRLQVRATDGTGATQTSATAPPAPSGATGWHTVEVTVDGRGARGRGRSSSPLHDEFTDRTTGRRPHLIASPANDP
ncbi:MAG: molybdopterin-dependent oxidoreductase [Acidimicrobiales bacterium]